MSAVTNTHFFGYKYFGCLPAVRNRIDSGKAEAGVSVAVHPQLPK
jgi:hypothetical protein